MRSQGNLHLSPAHCLPVSANVTTFGTSSEQQTLAALREEKEIGSVLLVEHASLPISLTLPCRLNVCCGPQVPGGLQKELSGEKAGSFSDLR